MRRNDKFLILLALLVMFLVYTASVYTRGTELSENNPMLDTAAIQGKVLWQKYNCSSCHQLYGLGGFIGPDLTTTISRKGDAYAKAIILSGTKRMPHYGITEQEADAITKFLSYVDSTAIHYKR
ncbi:MAG: cytochrome c [Cyclobacteriaceae bacterium]|nr:cytochrome c [Cyclobacteriaceae bacterium]